MHSLNYQAVEAEQKTIEAHAKQLFPLLIRLMGKDLLVKDRDGLRSLRDAGRETAYAAYELAEAFLSVSQDRGEECTLRYWKGVESDHGRADAQAQEETRKAAARPPGA